MHRLNRYCWFLLLGVMVSSMSPLLAQEGQPFLPRIKMPAESKLAAGRLEAADRLCGRIPDPEALVLLAGALAADGGGFPGTALTLAPLHSQDKWPEALEEYQRLIYESGAMLMPISGSATTVHSLQIRQLCHQRIATLPPAILRLYRQRVASQAQRWLQQAKMTNDVSLLRRLVDELFCSRFSDQALELLGDLAFEKGHFAEALRWWQLLAPSALARQPPGQQHLFFPDPEVDVARVRAKQLLAHLFQGDNYQVHLELPAYARSHAEAKGLLAGRSGAYLKILEDIIHSWEKKPFWEDVEPWATFAGNAARNRIMAACPSSRLWVDGPTWRVPLRASKNGNLASTWRRPPFYPLIVGDRVLLADGQTIKSYHLLTGAEVFRQELPEGVPGVPEPQPPERDAAYTLTADRGRLFVRSGQQILEPARNAAEEAPASYLICLNIDPQGGQEEGSQRWKIKAPPGALFEGVPLAHAGRIYTALSRLDGKHTKTTIACYDADSGAVRWQHEVCDTPEFELMPQPRARHHLLTLAGGLVVYCSHSGVILAVDAGQGHPAWALRYPVRSSQAAGDRSLRELCPCIYHGGRIFAAPQDSDRLLCLEAATGQLRWQREGLEVVHLLGVAEGQVLFTTPRGLQAVPATSGDDRRGWTQPAGGKLASAGRGLVLGGWVFWPTQYPHLPLRAINAADGSQDRPESATAPTYFDPTLLRHIKPGNMALAQGSLVVADEAELVVYVAPHLLLKDRRRKAGPLFQASAQALYQLAQAEAADGQIESAHQYFLLAAQKSVDDPGLHGKVLEQFHLFLMEAASLAERSGLASSARAWQLLQEGARQDFPPQNRAEALRRRAAASLRANQPLAALDCWQTILADESLRSLPLPGPRATWQRAGAVAAAAIAALLHLQKPDVRLAYEKQAEELLARARDHADQTTLARLVNEFPHTPAAAQARQILRSRPKIISPPTSPVSNQRPQIVPLERLWQTNCDLALPVTQPSPGPGQANFFLSIEGKRCLCSDANTGATWWEFPLAMVPTWAGSYQEVLLVAGPAGIQALDVAAGQPLWRLASEDSLLGPLGQFRLTSKHLLCLADGRLVLAVDIRSGVISWQSWAPGGPLRPRQGGRFQPHYYAGEKYLLLQTSDGQRLTLEANTGRLLHQTPASDSPWPHMPLPLDEQRLCLSEGGRLLLWNLASHQEEWSYQPPWPTSQSGEPLQAVGSEKGLLAVVPRNHGCDLVRLDPARGVSCWGDGVQVGRQPLGWHQVALQKNEVILVNGRQLQGRSLADGQLRWSAYLPEAVTPWRVLSAGQAVLAYPGAEEKVQGWWAPLPYFPHVWPGMRPPPWRGDEMWMVQLHDPKDGQLIQRLNLVQNRPGRSRLLYQGASNLVLMTGGCVWGVQLGITDGL